MTNSDSLPLVGFIENELIAPEGGLYSIESSNKQGKFNISGSPTSLIVDSVADIIDANDGVTTLREAIAYANSQSGVQNIRFDLAAGSQINLTQTLAIRSDLTISGDGVTIAGNSTFDNFFVNNADVVFDGLTIINGQDGIDVGNNSSVIIRNSSFSNNADDGIGITGNRNQVTITNVSLNDNAGDGIDIGGNHNSITIANASFSGNAEEAIADLGNKNIVTPSDVRIVIPIENAGFEDPVLEDFTFTTVPPPGWQLYNPDGLVPAVTTDESSSPGVFNPSTGNYPNGVPEGDNVSCIFLVDEIGSGRVGISQTLDTQLAANTRYTLSVAVGNPDGEDPVPGITFGGFPGYQVELLAGGQVLAVDHNSLEIAEGTFRTSTITYTTSEIDSLLGQSLEIRLINLLQGPGIEVDFDNVQLTAQPLSFGSTVSHSIGAEMGILPAPLSHSLLPELAVSNTPTF